MGQHDQRGEAFRVDEGGADASIPEGPAAPLVFRAVRQILMAMISSNTTGCMTGGVVFPSGIASGEAGCAQGYFSLVLSPRSMVSSTLKTPPLPQSESNCRAVLIFP